MPQENNKLDLQSFTSPTKPLTITAKIGLLQFDFWSFFLMIQWVLFITFDSTKSRIFLFFLFLVFLIETQLMYNIMLVSGILHNYLIFAHIIKGFPCGSAGKESTCSMRDLCQIPGLGRFPGERKGYHSSILVWRIPQTLQSMGLQKSGHD